MTLFFSAKEKKQKSNFHLALVFLWILCYFCILSHSLSLFLFHTVMRLGKKKEKDRDGEKEQCIDGIARLICSAKQSHPAPLRGEYRKFNNSSKFMTRTFLIIVSSSYSLHRRNGMDWSKILPTFITMANSCQKFPSGINWSSIRYIIDPIHLSWDTQLVIISICILTRDFNEVDSLSQSPSHLLRSSQMMDVKSEWRSTYKH